MRAEKAGTAGDENARQTPPTLAQRTTAPENGRMAEEATPQDQRAAEKLSRRSASSTSFTRYHRRVAVC